MAVGALVPIVEQARRVALASPDVETFVAAAPAQIFLVEGALGESPGNDKLRITASMLYFAYAFAKAEEGNPSYASYLYHKGMEHGRRALSSRKRLARCWEGRLEEFEEALGGLRRSDVPAATWTAANWGQWINLNLDSTAVLAEVPKLVALLERICTLDGSYMEGLPYIMLGSVQSLRPPLMGGNPEQARESFQKAFALSGGKMLLAYYFHARYYCYRIFDRRCFEESLARVLSTPAEALPALRLLNALAKDKALRLLEEEDEIF